MATPLTPSSQSHDKVRLCSQCHASKLWQDDAHEICFKCRGKQHNSDTCDECKLMGEISAKMWSEFVSGKAPKRYVTANEFESFQKKMEEMLQANAEMLQRFAAANVPAQPHVGAVGNSTSNRDSRPQVGAISNPVTEDEPMVIETNSEVSFCIRDSRQYHEGEVDEVRPTDSVSNTGSAERNEHYDTSTLDSDYQEVISELISVLGINDAVTEDSAHADIISSRVREKKSKVYLPLAQAHREIIDRVWENDTANISVFKQSVAERYHVTESDFDKYCKVGTLDKILAHALRKNGVTAGTAKSKADSSLKIPNADNAKVESRAWRIEREALSGIACSSVQSWLLQFLSKKLEIMDGFLKETFASEYENILAATGCDVLPKALLLAQDAALDQLDLWARVSSNAKSQRRLLWLQSSPWSKQLKDMVMRFPIEGGLVCGSRLLETLEECKNFDEALERVETPSTSKQVTRGGGNQAPRAANNPQKRQRVEHAAPSQSFHSSERGTGRGGRGGYRSSSHNYGASNRESSSSSKNWGQSQKREWNPPQRSWDRGSKYRK